MVLVLNFGAIFAKTAHSPCSSLASSASAYSSSLLLLDNPVLVNSEAGQPASVDDMLSTLVCIDILEWSLSFTVIDHSLSQNLVLAKIE